jgi:hypothetical protein
LQKCDEFWAFPDSSSDKAGRQGTSSKAEASAIYDLASQATFQAGMTFCRSERVEVQ